MDQSATFELRPTRRQWLGALREWLAEFCKPKSVAIPTPVITGILVRNNNGYVPVFRIDVGSGVIVEAAYLREQITVDRIPADARPLSVTVVREQPPRQIMVALGQLDMLRARIAR